MKEHIWCINHDILACFHKSGSFIVIYCDLYWSAPYHKYIAVPGELMRKFTTSQRDLYEAGYVMLISKMY